ncbi:MAG: hypothetical protein RL380_1335 [Verrucomicrobiota bacterium]|jgi:hypothetical protein
MKRFVFATLLAIFACVPTHAADPTALALVKEANRYVGEQSKDKLVQLRSEKSVASLTPQIWYVVLYDPTAALKATEVKFGAGQMLEVKRPFRLLEPVTGQDKILDAKRLNTDSDKALKIALKEPLLGNLKITASQLWLNRAGKFSELAADEATPVWKVKLWAAKLHQPNNDADLGDVFISANDGSVLKSDLHINRVD